MKVLHVSTPLSFRGGEQQIMYLLEAFAEQAVQQCLATPKASILATRARELGVQVVDLRGRLVQAFQVRHLQQQQQFDIAHAHDSHAHTSLWLSNLCGAKLPFVVSRRVARAPGLPNFSWSKYAHPNMRAVLCVSEAIAALHQAVLPATKPVHVVYSAVAKPAADAPDLRMELNLAPTTPLLGTVAALSAEKDFATFIRTGVQVLNQHPSLHLIHIGTGSPREIWEAERLVASSGISSRTHLLGFRQNAAALVGAFDVFLFTSCWEGLGSSILQAQVRGVPVVATSAGGIPELVVHEKTGLLAPVGASDVLAKAVTDILQNPDLRQRLVEAARLHAKKFSIKNMASQTLSAYHSALQLG